MKAVIWKELRELASRSIALLLLALTPVVIALYSRGIEMQDEVRVLTREVPPTLLFVSALAACALGFLQTLFDIRRDQWAFLIHRGESATRIFLAKVLAAGLIYAVITLTPVLTCAVWGMRGGIERFPFSWYLLVPMLAAIVSAIPFYFATLLAMRWQALWRANYLLPIAAPILSLAAFVIAIQSSEFIRPQLFLCWLLLAGVLGVAAWGAFVRSGESTGRPLAATICLGIPVYFAILQGLLLCTAVVEMGRAQFFKNDPQRKFDPHNSTGMLINEQGHVIAVGRTQSHDPSKWPVVLSFLDLDDPDSTRYQSLVGKPDYFSQLRPRTSSAIISSLRAAGQKIDWDPLLMTSFWVSSDDWWSSQFNFSGQQRVLDELGLENVRVPVRWIFSSADGLIYSYKQLHTTDELVRRQLPPRLVSIVGPDGFVEPGQLPARRFSRLLVNPSSANARRSMSIWPDVTDKGMMAGPGHYLVCEDALYCVNTSNRKVYQLHAAPAGKKIRYLTSLGPDFVVVYNDSVAVHEGTQDPIPGTQAAANPANLLLPGKLKYMAPIPREILHDAYIDFGKLENLPELVFAGHGSFNRSYRVVKTEMDGTIISSRSYSEMTPSLPSLTRVMASSTVLLPPGATTLGFGGDAVVSMMSGQGAGALARRWQSSRTATLYSIGVMAATTALCLWLASRTARRYGFSIKTRRIWQAVVVMLGPVGLLTLWFLRDWPAMEVCAQCQKRRPVDRENCPQCGAAFPNPHRENSEILASEKPAAAVPASAV